MEQKHSRIPIIMIIIGLKLEMQGQEEHTKEKVEVTGDLEWK